MGSMLPTTKKLFRNSNPRCLIKNGEIPVTPSQPMKEHWKIFEHTSLVFHFSIFA